MSINPLKFEMGSNCSITGIYDIGDYSNFEFGE